MSEINHREITIEKKYLYILLVAVFLVGAFIYYPKNTISNQVYISDSPGTINDDNRKVEVFHFHATNQCWSCKTLGNLAEKTINIIFNNYW